MSEESLIEIIGIAKKPKWNQIKEFIKFVVRKTLKKDAGYSLTAFDVSINGKKKPKYGQIINNKEKIKEIDKIKDFNHFSLYQTTSTVNNHINISQNNGILIFLAKYLGPHLDDHQIFDFSINLDAIDDPFFTIGDGKKINCSEILEIIRTKTGPTSLKHQETLKKIPTQEKNTKIEDLEVSVFKNLTNKNAIWNGSETKAFHKWKAKIKNQYRIETGKITHYKGTPTKAFTLYLQSLIMNINAKAKKLLKNNNKKPLNPKKDKEEITELYIFERITGKNAIWNGSETQNFVKWKQRIHNKYKKNTGKNPYYKQKVTNNYKDFLQKTLKSSPHNREK
ncbi:MAG: hypothetical protein ACFFG0_09460 [Candidatus Thorarchaeota archaeon]